MSENIFQNDPAEELFDDVEVEDITQELVEVFGFSTEGTRNCDACGDTIDITGETGAQDFWTNEVEYEDGLVDHRVFCGPCGFLYALVQQATNGAADS